MSTKTKLEHFFNDIWIEKGYKDPLAVITFKFSSEEAFTTNYPINVKVTILITKGLQKELLPLRIIFPDSFKHPQEITSPSGTPTAGIVKIRSSPPYEGEAVIEFTQSGSFGYIIFSKNKPRYYAANRNVITISPYDTRAILEKITPKHSDPINLSDIFPKITTIKDSNASVNMDKIIGKEKWLQDNFRKILREEGSSPIPQRGKDSAHEVADVEIFNKEVKGKICSFALIVKGFKSFKRKKLTWKDIAHQVTKAYRGKPDYILVLSAKEPVDGLITKFREYAISVNNKNLIIFGPPLDCIRLLMSYKII